MCFNNMPFQPTNVQVQVVRTGGSLEPHATNASTQQAGDISLCTGAEDAAVQFFNTSTTIADASPPRFFIVFWG